MTLRHPPKRFPSMENAETKYRCLPPFIISMQSSQSHLEAIVLSQIRRRLAYSFLIAALICLETAAREIHYCELHRIGIGCGSTLFHSFPLSIGKRPQSFKNPANGLLPFLCRLVFDEQLFRR